MKAYHQIQASEKQKFITVSRGGYAFTTILRPYMCATGPRAGWTKFSDADKLAIINRHLEADGKRPISRSSFCRWKGEARAAGLLDFTSSARRPGDRNRVTGGRWMKVLAVPARSQVVGRRPRRLHETFSIPPANETFSTTTKEEDLRDLTPPERSYGAGAVARKAERPSPPMAKKIPKEAKRFAAKLTRLAQISDPQWQPEPAKATMRERCAAKALAAIGDGLEHRAYVEVMVVGLARRRKRQLENAHAEGYLHPFWDVMDGDPVARGCAYFADADGLDEEYGFSEELFGVGASELERRWEIDAYQLDPVRGLTVERVA